MKTPFLLLLFFAIAVPIAGCSQGEKKTADHQPTDEDMETVRVFFLQEWNKRFIECNDWAYSRSDVPSRMYLGLKTDPSKFIYEWQALSETDRTRNITMRCTVFIATELSTVYADGSWFRPFKKASGYLVATDLFHGYPGADTREQRNDFLESKCVEFRECIGLNILTRDDGTSVVNDDGEYWNQLVKPDNCGEIPD